MMTIFLKDKTEKSAWVEEKETFEGERRLRELKNEYKGDMDVTITYIKHELPLKLYRALNDYENTSYLAKIDDPLTLVDYAEVTKENVEKIEELRKEIGFEDTIEELLTSDVYQTMKGEFK